MCDDCEDYAWDAGREEGVEHALELITKAFEKVWEEDRWTNWWGKEAIEIATKAVESEYPVLTNLHLDTNVVYTDGVWLSEKKGEENGTGQP